MMNERIRELARQAGLIAPYGSDREGLSDFDYREFAELIVRDIIKKIENEASTYAEPVWAFELVNDIKDAYGIE
jgi:hypothetical protein